MTQHYYGIARCRDAVGNTYPRSSIDRTPQPFIKPLHCDGRGCDAPITAVHGHERAGSTDVRPFFRLAQGKKHTEGCPFDVVAQLAELTKLAVVDKVGDVYRLNLDHFQQEAAAQQAARPERVGDPRTPANLTSDPDRVISPVLSAARDIARLIQASGDDPELISKFRARMNDGTQLTWDQFCWPAHRVDDLLADIARNPRRPRAVFGALHSSEVTGSAGTSRVLNISTAPSTSRTAVRIRTQIVELADRYTRTGAVILGLSQTWKPWRPTGAPPGPPTEVRMWATDAREVTTWDPS